MKINLLNRDKFFLYSLIILLGLNGIIFYINFLKKNHQLNPTNISTPEFALLPQDKSELVNYLAIKNRFGTIEFTKESPSPFPWIMTSHQNLLAETGKVESMILNLEGIKIKRQIKADEISIKNYSIDNPFLEISYLLSGQSIKKIKIGLINDLKKVAYIQYKNSNIILEVSYRSFSLFDNNFSSFTNNYPFNFIKSSATKIELHRGAKKIFEIQKTEGNWATKDNNRKKLNNKKVNQWLEKLSMIRNQVILDQMSEKQISIINKSKQLWRRYKLVIQTKDEKIHEYDFYTTPRIMDKDNKKNGDFVLIDKYRAFPIILDNNAKKLLSITLRSF